MWGTLLKAVAHVAVSSAVKQRMAARQGHATAPAPVVADTPAKRRRPGFPAFAVLFGMIGLCCLSTGSLAELGSLQRLLDAKVELERTQAISSLITGFVACIFPAIVLLVVSALSFSRHRFESRFVSLVTLHPNLPIDDVAKSLGTTEERVRTAWRDAAALGYVDPRADVHGDATPRSHMEAPTRPVAPVAPVPSVAQVASIASPAVTPPTPGAKRWSGTCPTCRAAVEVLLYPGMRPRCPACRASLGFQV